MCPGTRLTRLDGRVQRRLDRLGAAIALELDERGRRAARRRRSARRRRVRSPNQRLQPAHGPHRAAGRPDRCPSTRSTVRCWSTPRPSSPAVVVRVNSPASISTGRGRQLRRRAPGTLASSSSGVSWPTGVAGQRSRCGRPCRCSPSRRPPTRRDQRNDQQRGRDEPEDDLATSRHVVQGRARGGCARGILVQFHRFGPSGRLRSLRRVGGAPWRSIPTPSGTTGAPVRSSWTSKDSLLYAVGVGAGQEPTDPAELPFVTENSMNVTQRALPTMAVVLADVSRCVRDHRQSSTRRCWCTASSGWCCHAELPVVGRDRVDLGDHRDLGQGQGCGGRGHRARRVDCGPRARCSTW